MANFIILMCSHQVAEVKQNNVDKEIADMIKVLFKDYQ